MKTKTLMLAFFFLALSSHAQAKVELPPGTAMMWQQPGQNLNLFWGSGGEERRPVPPFTFQEEDFGGTNPKVIVTDQRGVRWGVKFGDEAQSEVAASRFFWAAGYRTDDVYFVPEGVIQGATNLTRARNEIETGTGNFKNARFQKIRTGPGVDKVQDYYIAWDWDDNPFVGTKELSGLLLMNVLLANFDTRRSNNKVQHIIYNNGKVENWYMTSDIGGTFGKSQRVGHSKWHLKDYSKEPFIQPATPETQGKTLVLLHGGARAKYFRSIPMEHARWIYGVIGGLSRTQIEDAFRAAFTDNRVAPLPNAEDEAVVQGFADAVQKYIVQLGQAVR